MNLRNLKDESLERRRENFNEEHCKAERNRAREDKTFIYNG